MRITSLLVKDWRNIPEAELGLDERLNVLWGPNGSGKTNLLEASGVLSLLKSFREAPWCDLIRWGTKVAEVGGRVEGSQGATWLRVRVDEEGRTAFVDGAPVKDLGPYFRSVRAVVFSPSDSEILRGAPELRRRFMDRAAFSARPEHLSTIRLFRRVLAQKAALLKTALQTGTRRSDELWAWNERLIPLGVALVIERRRIVEALGGSLSGVHAEISGGSPVLLDYRCAIGGGAETELAARYRRLLENASSEEWRRGSNLVGPQRDELDIRLWEGGGLPLEHPSVSAETGRPVVDSRWKPAKTFASQGQVRTLALSLKLAELEVASREGESPLLLLDDLSSELDHARIERLVRFLERLSAQVIVTTTDPSAIARFKRESMRAFHLVGGEVKPGGRSKTEIRD